MTDYFAEIMRVGTYYFFSVSEMFGAGAVSAALQWGVANLNIDVLSISISTITQYYREPSRIFPIQPTPNYALNAMHFEAVLRPYR
jgi:hypothetical protein